MIFVQPQPKRSIWCVLHLHVMGEWGLAPTILDDTFLWIRFCKRPGCLYHEETH